MEISLESVNFRESSLRECRFQPRDTCIRRCMGDYAPVGVAVASVVGRRTGERRVYRVATRQRRERERKEERERTRKIRGGEREVAIG